LIVDNAAVHMTTALFWFITQRVVIITCRRFGTDRLSRNVSKELPLLAA